MPVYATFETAKDTLLDTFANRAHNDILELWLEAGAMGIVLMGLFLAWLVFQSLRIWRHRSPDGYDVDVLLARAATLVIGLIVAHSVVDYPLRTAAMMAMFAFACGLLIEPLRKEASESVAEEDRRPRASDAPRPRVEPRFPTSGSADTGLGHGRRRAMGRGHRLARRVAPEERDGSRRSEASSQETDTPWKFMICTPARPTVANGPQGPQTLAVRCCSTKNSGVRR